MLDALRRLIGAIEVVEKNNLITVSGVPADVMMKDIKKIWETNRINQNLFTSIGKHGFSFNSFFGIEILYILQELVSNRKARTNIRAINTMIELLYENTWLSKLKADPESLPDIVHKRHLKRFKKNLFPYQEGFLDAYNERVPMYDLKGYLLSAAPGAGKTINSLALTATLEADITIIVGLKQSASNPWMETLSSEFVTTPTYWLSTENRPFDPNAEFLFFHYEYLQEALRLVESLPKGKRIAIILDECHHMNELGTGRTNFFIELCRNTNAFSVLWMSGTPVKAMGREIIPLLKTVDTKFDKDAEQRFLAIYGKSGTKGLDILAHRLGIVKYEVVKEQFRPDKVVPEVIKIKLPNGNDYTLDTIRNEMRAYISERLAFYEREHENIQQRYKAYLEQVKKHLPASKQLEFAEYEDAVLTIQTATDYSMVKKEIMFCNSFELGVIIPRLSQADARDFKDIRSVIKYVELKVQGEALGRILTSKRVKCHVDMVRVADQLFDIVDGAQKKTLIFTNYIEVLNEVITKFANASYKPLAVYKDTNKDLPAILHKFEKDVDANPLGATFKSLSTAVPLLPANTVIFLDKPYRDYIYTQTISRVDRVGQDAPVRAFELELDTGSAANISTRGSEILKWSRDQVEAITGKHVDEGISLESVLEEVSPTFTSVDEDPPLPHTPPITQLW